MCSENIVDQDEDLGLKSLPAERDTHFLQGLYFFLLRLSIAFLIVKVTQICYGKFRKNDMNKKI